MTREWAQFWNAIAVIFIALLAVQLLSQWGAGPISLPTVNLDGAVAWLEAHDKLAGWAQFIGAVIALFVTGWFARHEVRTIRMQQVESVKSFLLLVLFLRDGLMAVRTAIADNDHPRIVAGVRAESAAQVGTFVDRYQERLTSSFMLNNYSAVVGHIASLREVYAKVVAGEVVDDFLLRMYEEGIEAIGQNLAKEVRRLGGRCHSYDDPQLADWLPNTLRFRLKRWVRKGKAASAW